MTIKQIKRELAIDNQFLADAFGYASAVSFNNSERKKKIEAGVIAIYKRMKLIESTMSRNVILTGEQFETLLRLIQGQKASVEEVFFSDFLNNQTTLKK